MEQPRRVPLTDRPADWWKDAVVYQIYPRSFHDSDGDGIGDLNGITAKLDYIAALGVDVVWLSPHFDSPNADNGYDIRDYRKVMAEFGTMDDFDRMLDGLHTRGIELIVDLVVNHTSDEHAWFQESRTSRDNPYRDFYVWRDPKPDGSPPNNYRSLFGGPAWTHDPSTGQFYLHYFHRKQPDLNWLEERVRDEVYEIMRFWLDKGVAGFRMDVIPFISKQPDLPDLSPEELDHPEYVYANGPHLHDYLQAMHRDVLAPYNAVSVGEAFGVTLEQTPLFTDARRGELSMIFHFDLVRLDRDDWRTVAWTLPQLKAVVAEIDAAAGGHGWTTSYLCNHDSPRAVSHLGDDRPQWRERSAKALATFMLLLRATPFLYQGDELGMTNYPFEGIEDFEDVAAKGGWEDLVVPGRVPSEEFLHHLRRHSRDNARTPMQWSARRHGGFTSGAPWLPVNPNHAQINAEAQLEDPDSVFHHHRKLIELRRSTPAFVRGAYRDLDPEHEQVLAFARTMGDEAYLVAINFSGDAAAFTLPDGLAIGRAILDNTVRDTPVLGTTSGEIGEAGGRRLSLAPWQATVYELL